MPTTQLSQLIPVLQTAVGPVILLSLTNRFGRAVDRARQLLREQRAAVGNDKQRLAGQVENLYQRATLIQRAIIFSTVSLLFAAVLIITLFLMVLMKLELAVVISVLFICCLVSLIASLIAFIMDIRLSLLALKLELGHEESGSAV
jgi:Cu/Ag efflux pump CusA